MVPVEDAERLSVVPTHRGVGVAEAVGAAGVGFTVTETVPTAPVHPPVAAVTEYVPPAAVVATANEGFWLVEVKLLGPVHE